MSVVSLDPATELNDPTNPDIFLDSKIARHAERLQEVRCVTDDLCQRCNEADAKIRQRAKNVDNKLKQLENIHAESVKFWTIVGSAVAVLVCVKILYSSQALWKWFKQKPWQRALNRRSHSRDWRIIEF